MKTTKVGTISKVNKKEEMKSMKFRQGVIIDGTKELEILINHLSGLSDHYSWKDLDNIRFYKKMEVKPWFMLIVETMTQVKS